MRLALNLPNAPGALKDKWGEYLDGASDAIASAGIAADEHQTRKFLNRLLGLPVQMQNWIFSHFSAELDEQVKMAKQNDKYDEGVVDIRGESITIADGYPATLATDRSSGVGLVYQKLVKGRDPPPREESAGNGSDGDNSGGGAVIVPLDSDGPLRHAYAPTGGYSGTRSLPRGAVEPGGFDGGGGDADAASVAPAVRRPPPRLVKTHWPKEYGGAPLAPPGGSDAIRRATNAIVLHR